MSHELIKIMFEKRLSQYAEANNYRVALQNVKFTPNANETYFRSNLIPSGTESFTLSGDHRQYRGIYQIDIITPPLISTAPASRLMDEIEELFPLYQPIYEIPNDRTSFMVQPISPLSRHDGFSEPTHFLLPASFQYRADVVP